MEPMRTIGVRLSTADLVKVDEVVSALAHRNPDLRPTRSDAIRVLISQSGSVAGQLIAGISIPRQPLPGDRTT